MTDESAPSMPKKARKQRVKVEHDWKDDEIFKLISLVEEHREIWDKQSHEYKLPKTSVWQQIETLFEEKFSWIECKAK